MGNRGHFRALSLTVSLGMILMSLAGVALPAQASAPATPRDMANCCARMKNRCLPTQGRHQ
ncbi:MAG: hypothetical protein ACRD2D_03865 [Terriglobales bacterium]